ncbi:MAG: hypothetical protein PHQ60_04790 [Sideroxydans sp.]|nr:hypothetical protein [Sideroxydans sp.]
MAQTSEWQFRHHRLQKNHAAKRLPRIRVLRTASHTSQHATFHRACIVQIAY